jgi:hypothetical protein
VGPTYLADFDFRYNRRTALGFTDATRTDEALMRAKASASSIGGLVKPQTNRRLAGNLARKRRRKSI